MVILKECPNEKPTWVIDHNIATAVKNYLENYAEKFMAYQVQEEVLIE